MMQDTSTEALARWRHVFKVMPASRKWQMLGEAFAAARALHACGVKRRNSDSPPDVVQRDWLKRTYHLNVPSPGTSMSPAPNLSVLREVVGVLQTLGIDYALGGSMASSVFGVARFTQDADLTVAPFPGKEEAFAQSFGPDYYLSLSAIQEAVRNRTSFNVIQTREGFKVDFFVCKDEPFEQGALVRRVALALPGQSEPIFFQSPEDICLFKLRRYRLGNETSGQQWQDVLGVLNNERERLDRTYLATWAARLGVEDLLMQAWREVEDVHG